MIGSGTDCLDLNSIVPIGDDGGFGINNTTFFHLSAGTIVSLSRTTIQPVEDPSFGPTHINVKNLLALSRRLPREVGMAEALEMLGKPLEGTHHRGCDDAWNIAGILAELLWG